MKRFVAAALLLASFLTAPPAAADRSVIKQPGAHPDYVFEAEPHLLLAPFDDLEPGVGFRGTIEIVDNGFVKTINNTVGIGFGPGGTRRCRERKVEKIRLRNAPRKHRH